MEFSLHIQLEALKLEKQQHPSDSKQSGVALLPAGHHQTRQTFEKSHISFFLQVVQHFLQQKKKKSKLITNGSCEVTHVQHVGGMYLLDQDVPPVQDRNA